MNYAQRRSFDLCPETCPDVDGIMRAASDDIKHILEDALKEIKTHGTLKLRAALVEACEEIDRLEGDNNSLQDQVDSLVEEIEQLKQHITQLESAHE